MSRYLLLICICISMLFSNNIKKKPLPADEIGRYQLETVVYESKKGIVCVVETILDTKTGKVVVRRKKKASRYKLPYRDGTKTIYEE